MGIKRNPELSQQHSDLTSFVIETRPVGEFAQITASTLLHCLLQFFVAVPRSATPGSFLVLRAIFCTAVIRKKKS